MMLGTPSTAVNRATERGVRSLVGVYGGDIENPRTIDRNMPGRYRLDPRIIYHDVGPSPLIVLLVIGSAIAILASRRRVTARSRIYLLCAAAALFLTAGLVGYNFAINRILLVSLLILEPTVGVGASILLAKDRTATRAFVFGVLALAFVWAAVVMLFNSTNRLVPPSLTPVQIGRRDLGYWNTQYQDLTFRRVLPQLERPYKDVAGVVRRDGYTRVAIDSEALNVSIYPLLSLLSDREVRYVGHTLLRDRIKQPDFSPHVVLEIAPESRHASATAGARSSGDVLYGPASGLGVTITLYRARTNGRGANHSKRP